MTPSIKDSLDAFGCRLAPRRYEIANRPPDAAVTMASWADECMTEIVERLRSEMARRDGVEARLRSECDWNADWAEVWRRRHKSAKHYGMIATALLAMSVLLHIWRSL